MDKKKQINDRWEELVSDKLRETCVRVGVDLEALIDEKRWIAIERAVETVAPVMPTEPAFDYFLEIQRQHLLYMDEEGRLRRESTTSTTYVWKPGVVPL